MTPSRSYVAAVGLLVVCGALVTLAVVLRSTQPPGHQEHETQQADAHRSDQGTFIAGAPETNDQQATGNRSEAKNQAELQLPWHAWLVSSSPAEWTLAGIGLLTGVAAIWTLVVLNRQLHANIVAAHAAKRSADALAVIERAYVTMSHRPPGLVIKQEIPKAGFRDLQIVMRVRNTGNTPATVTAWCLDFVFDTELPENLVPLTESVTTMRSFLVTDGTFNVSQNVEVEEAAVTDLIGGKVRLYVIGFVDYIDRFAQRHRAGYARVYEPAIDRHLPRIPGRPVGQGIVGVTRTIDHKAFARRNNLGYVLQPGYNYDRPRQPGEGNDWNEPSASETHAVSIGASR